MSSVLENQQMLAALFAPVTQTMADYNAGRLGLAQMQLRRAQQLQDQQTADNLRRELTSAQIAAEDRRTEATINGVEQKMRAAQEIADTKAKAAQDAMDKRLEEERKKQNRTATRKAYLDYTASGGTKKLEEFGPPEDEDTLFKIAAELGPLARARAIDSFKGQAALIGQMEDELRSSLELTPDEHKAISSSALDMLRVSRDVDGAGDFVNAIEGGRSPDVAAKKFPQAAAAYSNALSQLRAAKTQEKASSKDFLMRSQQLGLLRRSALEDAQKNQVPSDVLSQLFLARKPQAQAVQPDAIVKVPQMNRTGGNPTVDAMRDTFGGGPVISPQRVAAEPEYGGVLGFLSRAAQRTPDIVDLTKLGLSYASELPAGGLNYLAGGMRRYNEGLDEREQARKALMDLINARGNTSLNYRPLYGL